MSHSPLFTNHTNNTITDNNNNNSNNNNSNSYYMNDRGRWIILGMIIMYLMVNAGALPPLYIDLVIVYRGMWLLVLYVFLSGLNVLVWERYNINYLTIFGFDPKNGSTFLDFFEAAASLAFIWSVGIILYMSVVKTGIHSFGLGATPLALSFIFWAVVLSPSNIFYKSTRDWIARHVWGFLLGPFALVNFASCWVADQFTSATVALVDFEYTVCHYFYDIANVNCFSLHKFFQPACVAFPFVWRLVQCLKQYSDTRQRSHLLNAGKYATSLVAIFFSTLHLITQVNPNTWSVYRSYWVVAIVMSTLYSYTWDVTMDWGFFKRHSVSKKFILLREVLIYEKPAIYYFVMVTNLLMRLTWLINLNPEYFGIHFKRDILVFFLASVELIRRVQWNFFRMEYEHINRFYGSKASKHEEDEDEKDILPLKHHHRHLLQKNEEEIILDELN